MLYDEQESATVRVKEVPAPDRRIALEILVLNKGQARVNFGPGDVKISTLEGLDLPVIPYEALVLKEEKRQKSQRFWSRLAAAGRAMSASQAGTTYGSGSYSGLSNGQIGGTNYSGLNSGTFNYTETNHAAASAAQQNAAALNAAERQALEVRQSRDMAAYNDVLRLNTIEPDTVSGGTVQFDVPKELRRVKGPVSVQMSVVVGGVVHQFLGQLQKVPK